MAPPSPTAGTWTGAGFASTCRTVTLSDLDGSDGLTVRYVRVKNETGKPCRSCPHPSPGIIEPVGPRQAGPAAPDRPAAGSP